MKVTDKIFQDGLTFDDVTLIPAESDVLHTHVDTSTILTHELTLNIPIISAPLNTVTESRMAIAIARIGGMGIIHHGMSPQDQADEVDKVKRSESGMIRDPVTLKPDQSIRAAIELMNQFQISGIPITENGILIGIITNRDLRFEPDLNRPIRDLMTSQNLITVREGTSLESAKKILQTHRIEKLPVVDDQNRLKGLITIKDIRKKETFPHSTKDPLGRLRVGASVSAGSDLIDRVNALVSVKTDLICIDAPHAHYKGVLKAVEWVKNHYPDQIVMAGNVVTREGADALIQAGADIIKVGFGFTSTTTSFLTGVAVPQITAILNVYEIAGKHNKTIISHSPIRSPGDLCKACAAGAHAVMIGSMLAGTDESPGDITMYQGRSFKVFRKSDPIHSIRYDSVYPDIPFEPDVKSMGMDEADKRVPYIGSCDGIIRQFTSGLKMSMSYCGCKHLKEFREKTRFIRITDCHRDHARITAPGAISG